MILLQSLDKTAGSLFSLFSLLFAGDGVGVRVDQERFLEGMVGWVGVKTTVNILAKNSYFFPHPPPYFFPVFYFETIEKAYFFPVFRKFPYFSLLAKIFTVVQWRH